jgi:hypothetical protein
MQKEETMKTSRLIATTLTIAGLSFSGFANASLFADPEAGSPQVDLINTYMAASTTRAEVVAGIKAAGAMVQRSSGWFADPEAGSPQVDLIAAPRMGTTTRAEVASDNKAAGAMVPLSSAWFADPEAGSPQVDRIGRNVS